MNEGKKSDEKKTQELKLQETTRPTNQRASAMPTSGFVLSVDGKLKTQYETAEQAAMAATKLKQSYPMIKVQIYCAAARVSTSIDSGQSPS